MKKALVVRGGWDGHEPQQSSEIFIKWLKKKGFDVVVSDSMDVYADSELMSSLSVVVPVWTMGTIEKEQWQGLEAAVMGGAGIAGWHGGMCDSFRQNTNYQFMTGGQWVAHPGGVIDYRVNVIHDPDGFMDGLKDFDMNSEQYYMHTDPGNKVYATTTFTGDYGDTPWIRGTVMPVCWKRTYGKGRVFYTSLGHVAKDFDVPEVAEIVKRGIQWAAREEIVFEYQSK